LLNKTIAKILNSGKISQSGTALKIYYAAQINSSPIEFKFFVNNTSLFKKETLRYLEKQLQKEFDLFGLPMIIHLEGKQKRY
jgi:GTP-binding protein